MGTCTDATNLVDLLETYGFVQHARGATHERGNLLDLVITSETSCYRHRYYTDDADH